MRISDWSSDVCSAVLRLHLRMVRAAETQRVEVGDRARAHGEDVAQYAADPGRRALIGFDIRRVVVAFHLEDGGELLAARAGTDVDHAGIFAGAADHPRDRKSDL